MDTKNRFAEDMAQALMMTDTAAIAEIVVTMEEINDYIKLSSDNPYESLRIAETHIQEIKRQIAMRSELHKCLDFSLARFYALKALSLQSLNRWEESAGAWNDAINIPNLPDDFTAPSQILQINAQAEVLSARCGKLLDGRQSSYVLAEKTASMGIDLVEKNLAEPLGIIRRHMPTFYYNRAAARYNQSLQAGNNSTKKQFLQQALEDVDKALGLPDSYYFNPEVRTQIRELRKKIQADMPNCFIATAAYGSILAPEVTLLRHFREKRLRPTQFGRWLIRIYERYSPPLADWIAVRPVARIWVQRLILTPLVWLVQIRG